jgi:hypothetical protein
MRNILRDVDVACRQVKSVAKRTTATLANIMAFVGKDRGFNQNEGGLKRRSPSKTELSGGRGAIITSLYTVGVRVFVS